MHPNSERLLQRYVTHLIEPGAHVWEIAPDDVPSSWRKQVDVDVVWEVG